MQRSIVSRRMYAGIQCANTTTQEGGTCNNDRRHPETNLSVLWTATG